ncbi:MAG: DUF2145 domain-containing protein [Casimicrobium sp.]
MIAFINRLLKLSTIALAALLLSHPAHAGRSCESKPPDASRIARGLTLAERTNSALNASGAKVVLLARAGQDLSKYGLNYSHLGWAYKSASGQWLVVHKLNTCGTAEASIYRQGLGDFFLDDPYRFETAWVVPSPIIQDRMSALLQDNRRVVALHAKPYSIVSYVWSTKYQQSNQWALETFALAMAPDIRSREQAQAWLKLKGYEPTTLKIDPLTRLGGRMSAVNIAFDDHPNDKRFSDRIETVTVDSMFNWFNSASLGDAPSILRL